MNKHFDIAIIGGDKRQVYLADHLKKSGYEVVTVGLPNLGSHNSFIQMDSMKEAMESSKYILAPVPMTRGKNCITAMDVDTKLQIDEFCDYLQPEHFLMGGNITSDVKQYCTQRQIEYYDFMEDSDIAYRNAIATAEGTIAEAIIRSTGNLYQCNGLVLGYGRCAKVLAMKLKALDMKVTIGARKQKDRTEAEVFGYQSISLIELKENIQKYEYIFNTIPDLILDKEILYHVSEDTVIIDIASAPGGIDYEAATLLRLNAHLYLGIPGKVAPKASAKILADAVMLIVKERSD